jgi:hypothetical protein
MVGSGSSGGGGEEGFTGRAAIGYDHSYDAESSISVWLSTRGTWRVGYRDALNGQVRMIWMRNSSSVTSEDETQREVVIESLQTDCEERSGTPLE